MTKNEFLKRYYDSSDSKKDIEGLVQIYEMSVDWGLDVKGLYEEDTGSTEKILEKKEAESN